MAAAGAAVLAGPDEVDPADRIVHGFFAAYNSGDPERMLEFYRTGATEDFRSRRSDDEDRELYLQMFGDTGTLAVESILADSPERVGVGLRSPRIPDPVRFVFTLDGALIDGFSIQIGGPDEGGGAKLPVPDLVGKDPRAIAAALGRMLDALPGEEAFSGVVLVARDGEPLFHEARGLADRDKQRPNEISTWFDVGSITKALTKVAVGQLLRDGKLRLEDTILDRLPDYPDREIAARVTIEQLLEHRSGLGDIFNERYERTPKERLLSPRDFFPLFAGEPLLFEPGEGRSYSNAGYIVLGAIVEAVSDMPFDGYVEKHVLEPAGMKHSGFVPRDGSDPRVAVGYTRHGAASEAPRPSSGDLPLRGCPAGSSSHTALDLLRLEQALRDGRLLGPGWSRWFFTGVVPQGPAVDEARADWPIGIAGGGPGVCAALEGDGRTTVIVLSNQDPPLAEELASAILRSLEGA